MAARARAADHPADVWPGPYFGWYGVVDDGDPARSFVDRVSDASVAFTYTDVEAALDRVEAAIDERGPFDALCAFSQGAVVATLLTARALARERAGGAGPSWRHNLLVCGIPPRDARYDLSAPLDFPATLVHGAQDELAPYGRRLAECYAAPRTLEHPDGHRFRGRRLVHRDGRRAERGAAKACRIKIGARFCHAGYARSIVHLEPTLKSRDSPTRRK